MNHRMRIPMPAQKRSRFLFLLRIWGIYRLQWKANWTAQEVLHCQIWASTQILKNISMCLKEILALKFSNISFKSSKFRLKYLKLLSSKKMKESNKRLRIINSKLSSMKEVHRLTKMSESKYATWEMAVGLTIISLKEFKLDSIEVQKWC